MKTELSELSKKFIATRSKLLENFSLVGKPWGRWRKIVSKPVHFVVSGGENCFQTQKHPVFEFCNGKFRLELLSFRALQQVFSQFVKYFAKIAENWRV